MIRQVRTVCGETPDPGNPPLQMCGWLACTAWLDNVAEVHVAKYQQSRLRFNTAARLLGSMIWPTSAIRILMTFASVTANE